MTCADVGVLAVWAWSMWCEGLRPEPSLTVSIWAEKHRILPLTSPFPGPWRADRTPYLREIMDCLSARSPIELVVFIKGAQLGATEAGNNWIGYVIHNAPGLMLVVLPSLDDVKRNSGARIDPLIEESPVLRERVVPPSSREPGNSIARKKFLGGELVLTGATSAKGLRSIPARYLFMDEVDGYPLDADNEGDPVALAIQRTVTFIGRRKIYMVSTPTVKGASRIEAAYEESDRRVYEVPCKHCGTFSHIRWPDIHWPEGHRERAYWACPSCGGVHENHDKPRLLAGGRWRPTAGGNGKTAGFHLSGLYSPFESWGDIAQQQKLAGKDPARLKSWVNLKLGESWEDRIGEKIEPKTIAERAEAGDWTAALPAGVAVVTAGVDVQDDRLELELVGWGAGEESWSLEYCKLPGCPGEQAVWQELDELLRRSFPHSRSVPDLPVSAVCIDTGGHHTAMVYRFVGDKANRRIWGIKGASTPRRPIWPRKPSRKNKGRVPVYLIGTDTAKEQIFGRLKLGSAGPGSMHFPAGRDAHYFAQLVAERVKTVAGRRVFDAGRRRNEALDLKVYNLAALHGLYATGLRLDKRAAELAAAPMRDLTAPAPPAPTVKPAPARRVGRSRYLQSIRS